MVKKLLFLLSLLLILLVPQANGSHILGGEISYRCLGNGLFEFTVIVFRDCQPGSVGYTNQTINLLGPHGSAILPFISSFDVTPRCATAIGFSCDPPSSGNGNNGSISRFMFRGNVNLTGVAAAPPTGHVFYATLPCCRPNVINNIIPIPAPGQVSQALQVRMFPFTDPLTGLVMTPAQICDNSPNFISDPTALAILNQNDTVYFQNFAIDLDIEDSIVYSIDAPLMSTLIPIQFIPPYSINNPFPGILGPPFVSAVNTPINPVSGEIVFRPISLGTFVMVLKVTSYRCGQRISEVFRDFNLKVIPNPPGSPPIFNPDPTVLTHPFGQRAPIIQPYFTDAAGRGIYEITYYAGDLIDIPVAATDYFPTLVGNPNDPTTWVGIQNQFSVVFNGSQISANNNPLTGCPFPPCATLRGITDPSPPAPIVNAPVLQLNGNGLSAGLGYTALSEGGGRLVWRPECSNLPSAATTSCGTSVTNYQFSVTATDRNCPIEGKDVRIYTFNIKDLPNLKSPDFYGISANNSNNGVTLFFKQDLDTLTVDPIDSFNYFNQSVAFRLEKSVERRKRSFQKYRVYRATSPTGPFTQVDSIDLLYTYQRVLNGLDLVNNDYYFYLTTVSSCASFESLPSDTLKVIRMNLNNNVVAGMAELDWDSTAVVHNRPYFPNASGMYVIEREVYSVNPGVWEDVDTVLNLYEYNQPVVVCDDSVNYRVALLDTNGTRYYSNIDGDRFVDDFSPDSVNLYHVSVDSITGLPVLSWMPGPSPDVIAYIIYRLDSTVIPPVWRPIDTIYGFNNTYWQDTTSLQNPYDSSLHYGVAGMDSCGNTGLISRLHSSMHLTGGLDQCISSIVFNWNGYVGWNVSSYDIFRSAAGGPYTLLATVPGGQPAYSYIDNSNLVQDSLYCYAILARRAGDDTTALSNHICVTARVIKQPEYSYIRRVTVDTATNYINVVFVIDTAADAGRFELYRSTAATDFRRVTSFTPAQMNVNGGFLEYAYEDEEVDSDEEIYYYTVYVYDLCDQLYDTSNVSNNIFLQAVPQIDFNNRLRWNNYATWLGGVDRYEILRYIPNYDPGFLPLNTLGANSIVYNDDIKDFTDNDGLYSYLIQAVEGAGNPAGFLDTVLSNKVNVLQQPRIFMPTAFVPQGVNRILQPKGVFIEEIFGYNFEIYNRWGEVIFRSISLEQGWNGTHAGTAQLVDPGVYIYVVNFIGKNGKPYSQNGTFTVIR
jgi:hypothetical protein